MKKRSPWAVLLLPIITLGIYSWYWEVKTKGEMNKMGEKIPTAWLWLIPFVGYIWWAWKYSEAVEHVTKAKVGAILSFLLLWLTGSIGEAILQTYYNNLGAPVAEPANNAASSQPAAPAAAPVPAAPAPTPDPAPATESTPTPPATPPANLVQ